MRGQVVDVDLVALGDVEGAAVTRTVEKVVVVGRAGREAEATGEHVEDAEHLGPGASEVGDEDVNVGVVRSEAKEEDALDEQGVDPNAM